VFPHVNIKMKVVFGDVAAHRASAALTIPPVVVSRRQRTRSVKVPQMPPKVSKY
jgi:hypothetical protein